MSARLSTLLQSKDVYKHQLKSGRKHTWTKEPQQFKVMSSLKRG